MKTNLALYLILMTAIFLLLPLLIVGLAPLTEAPVVVDKEQLGDKTEVKSKEEKEQGLTISVFNHIKNEVVEMNFEDYITGVVTAEMPAAFELEALKAQSVAARTYAYRKLQLGDTSASEHKGAIICTNPAHCQAWTSMDAAKKEWGIFKAGYNVKKITKAVSETRGMILTYDGKIANPLYHANSGGTTENSEEVWDGIYEPYLRSVESRGEEKSSSYKVTINIEAVEFVRIFLKKFPDAVIDTDNIEQELEITAYTTGGRVKTIRVGSMTIKGTEFRSMLSLRSANFTIEADKSGMLNFTTRGNGHGVGMSQWGANNLAQKGARYDEILRYYYRGISLVTIEEFKKAQSTELLEE